MSPEGISKSKIEQNTEDESAEPIDEHDGKEPEDIDADEVFKKVELEMKENAELDLIRELVTEWLRSQKPRIEERLNRFGADKESADILYKQICRDLSDELRFAGKEFDNIKEGLEEMKGKLKQTPEIEAVADWLHYASKLALYKLFGRKFSGELSGQDTLILMLINAIRHKGVGGTHTPIYDEVNISFYNEKGFGDWEKVLDHELTHFGLNAAVPEAAKIQMQGQMELSKDKSKISIDFAFSGLLTAINESAAHLAEGRQPDFASYSNKVSPRTFRSIYDVLAKSVEGKDAAESDRIFTELYKSAVEKWHEDMTLQDVAEAIVSFGKSGQ